MSRATDFPVGAPGAARTPIIGAASASVAAASAAAVPLRKQCCPYCGATNAVESNGSSQPCPRCTMEDTPATRAATKSRIGPWYVLQSRNPAAPGMKWSTLLMLVERGQVSARSVVRGPTTHQLWRFAAHVKGLSREFGLCYSCGLRIEKTAHQCPHCDRLQELPANPDALLETREPMMREPVHREIKAPAMAPAPLIQESKPQPPPPKPKAMEFALPPRGAGAVKAQTDALGEIGHPPTDEFELPRASNAVTGSGTGWHPDPGILSAKELAHAFQLDFNPQAPPRPRRRVLKSLVTVLLLAGIGFTGLMLLSTDLRMEIFAWAGRTRDSVQEYFANRGKKTSAPTTGSPSASQNPSNEVATPAKPQAAVAAPATQPAANPGTTVAPPAHATEADIKPPQRQAIADPLPKNDASAGKPDVKVDAKSVSPAIDEDPVDQARALWVHAIDAEARQDYPEAIKLYEQIKKLPANAWPAGLEIRLAAARKQLE